MKYGYIRVSTNRQEVARQRGTMAREGVPKENIFEEINVSAFKVAPLKRPQFKLMFDKLLPGDVVIFDAISRLSRNTIEAQNMLLTLTENGIDFVIANSGTDTRLGGYNASTELFTTITAAFAQNESQVKSERIKAGIRAKKEKDPDWQMGQPLKFDEETVKKIRKDWYQKMPVKEIMEKYDIKRGTLNKMRIRNNWKPRHNLKK